MPGMNPPTPVPTIPADLARDLPEGCLQVLLVLPPSIQSITGGLWMLERAGADEAWMAKDAPIAVALGRNGLAWGIGLHQAKPPAVFAMKREGDGCSPAGIFRLPFAFGYAENAGEFKLPYRRVTGTMFGIDDVKSRYYNQVVDTAEAARDWTSDETMLRADGLYRLGIFVAHNPGNEPGAGSCIFLHLWRGPGSATAGCTAMAEADLLPILRWLDPEKKPLLVQGLTAAGQPVV